MQGSTISSTGLPSSRLWSATHGESGIIQIGRRKEMSHKTGLSGEMPLRALGDTGVQVSLIGLGGWHLGFKSMDEELSIRIIRTAVDNGINFMDNCWDYNEGASEVRMGKALRDGYRERVFLMTKIDGRTKEEATKQLDESLRRMQTDHIDLVQHHEILRYEDPHRIFDEQGANAALLEARDAGKIRFIGFTGHKDPRIHVYMLEVAKQNGFKFDTVQMPLNVMDAHYRSFEKTVLPELVKQNIGVLAMKTLANGTILESNTVTATECLQYAMNLPTSVVITGCESLEDLEQALNAARTFKPMTNEQVSALLSRTERAAARGEFELFKTTSVYDGTASHPEWLGEEPPEVQRVMQS
jgi:predicted aldo/keto reductase-like oxidoreductase